MTAEDTKKALECCVSEGNTTCKECPLFEHKIKFEGLRCDTIMIQSALALINRYEEKIKNLEIDLESAHSLGKSFKNLYDREVGKKNTAIQDYAERLHDAINPDWCKIHKLIDDTKEEIMEVYK